MFVLMIMIMIVMSLVGTKLNSEQHTLYIIYQLKVNHIKLKLKAVNKVLELCKVWMIF